MFLLFLIFIRGQKMKGVTYKNYVKKGMWKAFEKVCKSNSLNFYGCGILLTVHLVMEDLMGHTYCGVWKMDKCTPKEAWEDAFEQFDGHSGMSAAIAATIIAKFSPRGEEFAAWCKKNNIVDVNW
jgi:hypothetical protein